MFEVIKLLIIIGIGFDNLLEDVWNSMVLIGNDFGQLVGVEVLLDEMVVNEYKLIELSDLFMELEDYLVEFEQVLY